MKKHIVLLSLMAFISLPTFATDVVEDYFDMAKNFYRSGDFSQSLEYANQILKTSPTHFGANYLIKPLVVGSGIKIGLNVKYDNPKEVGADRIVNSVAAYYLYGGPCITIDCGTATTFNVISDKGEFLGGLIGHGLKSASDALSKTAEKLPKIELTMPRRVVGRTTITNMQSGLLQGYVGMAERIVRLIKEETGYSNAKVIATGGLGEIIKNNSDVIDVLDRKLTLKGLNIIYKLNTEKNL